jgi:hypothetical protein
MRCSRRISIDPATRAFSLSTATTASFPSSQPSSLTSQPSNSSSCVYRTIPAATQSADPPISCSSSQATPIALIAGLSVGGAVLLGLLVAAYFFLRRRRMHRTREQAEAEPYDVSTRARNHRISLRPTAKQTPPDPLPTVTLPSIASGRSLTTAERPSEIVPISQGQSRSTAGPNSSPNPQSSPPSSETQERHSLRITITEPTSQQTDEASALLTQEADAGVVLEEASSILPPAYNPDWDQRH